MYEHEIFVIATECQNNGYDLIIGDRSFVNHRDKVVSMRNCGIESIHEAFHELGHILIHKIDLSLPTETFPPNAFKVLEEYLAWYIGYVLCVKNNISTFGLWETARKNWSTYHFNWRINHKYKK